MSATVASVRRSSWLLSRPIDLAVLFAPVWAVWVIAFCLPESIVRMSVPLWMWVLIVLCIDVSHVWSTIYRTYLDREERTRHRRLLIMTPLLCLGGALAVAFTSLPLYWRVMAYLALFHFIKQQFGFMALYKAKLGLAGRRPKRKKLLDDGTVIYFSMLYPVVYWHLERDRLFGWFVDRDFFSLREVVTWLAPGPVPEVVFTAVYGLASIFYWLVLGAWLLEELYTHWREGLRLPVGKLLWILTTGINWYLGIVYFSSELVFSMTNMVAHGVPYLALIFVYVERKRLAGQAADTDSGAATDSDDAAPPRRRQRGATPRVFATRLIALNVAFMMVAVLLIALVEEYLWDLLVNRNKGPFFEWFMSYPMSAPLDYRGALCAVVIAVLSLPQLTHYFLDGYIWRGKGNPHLVPLILKR